MLTLIQERIRVFNRRLNIIERRLRALENPVPEEDEPMEMRTFRAVPNTVEVSHRIPITYGPGAEEVLHQQMTGDRVALYLEAHVTIEPVFDERRDEAVVIAQRFGFRLADLLMKKRAEDTEERSAKDTFMTGHSKSKADINRRTSDLVLALRAAQFKVWRYKVEDTLLDSRHSDVWGLLS